MAKSNAASFTDWTQATEWTTRISQTSVVGDDYIRVLTVIGDKPAATAVIKELSNGRRKSVAKDHTINFTIDDVSDANYEFMRSLECGGQFKVWYETYGGKMYGGNDGQLIYIDANDILNRGRDETETIAGTITWRAPFHPERITSPIFGSSTDNVAPSTYDTVQTFGAATTDTDAGVTTTVPATNANLKFEFNAITPLAGLPQTMILRISGVQVATVDFPQEYLNTYFRFTSTANVVYVKQFKDGTVNLA